MLSFAFDDGNVSQLKDIYPILRKFGFCATFYVIAERIGFPGRLDFDDLRLLESEGNEIGSHSLTHRSLTRLASEEIEKEANGSLQVLRRFRVRSFAYPFGNYDDRVLGVVRRYYESARSYRASVTVSNKPQSLQRYALDSFPIEGEFAPLIDINSEHCILPQQSILLPDDWLILTLHGRTSINRFSIRSALKPSNLNHDQVRAHLRDIRNRLAAITYKPEICFTEKLDRFLTRIEELGIPVVTVSQGLERFSHH
jgi:peptidoglycan/xylan/chitin deacetylase (PgdA/CDA1 family)